MRTVVNHFKPEFTVMAGAVGGAIGRKVSPVLLGYPDEEITEQYSSQVGFSTNKIGGFPVR